MNKYAKLSLACGLFSNFTAISQHALLNSDLIVLSSDLLVTGFCAAPIGFILAYKSDTGNQRFILALLNLSYYFLALFIAIIF